MISMYRLAMFTVILAVLLAVNYGGFFVAGMIFEDITALQAVFISTVSSAIAIDMVADIAETITTEE